MSQRAQIEHRLRLVASASSAKRLAPGSVIAKWNNQLPKDISIFADAGIQTWELPLLNAEDEKDLLDRYHEIITDIGVESGPDSDWWFTWTSSRDRFHSRILSDMELATRFEMACAQGLPVNLVVHCPDPHLVGPLKEIAARFRIAAYARPQDRLTWLRRRARMMAAPFVRSAKVCGRVFLIRWKARTARQPLDQARQALQRIVLVTWLKCKNLSESGPPDDTFFGRLPEYLESGDRSIVVIGDTLDGIPSKQARKVESSKYPVFTMWDFLGYRDLVCAFVRSCTARPRFKSTLQGDNSYLDPLVRADIHSNRAAILYALLVERSLGRLAKELRPTELVHIWENIPWERACFRAARTMVPSPKVTGYLHCAVILSHTRIVIGEKEKSVRPRPSKIICTGDRARDIMVRFSGHTPEELVAGCALRHEYLAKIPSRPALRRPVRNILVVLEGLPTMAALVKLVHETLNDSETYRTVVRPHPAYGLGLTLSDAGLATAVFRGLSASKNPSIMDDFEEADLVIYKGSTAALEAGYMGIPLVHFKQQNLLTDDPLFEISSLKEVIETPEELLRAIERFSAMDEGVFHDQHSQLRRYIDEYLSMPTADNTSVFVGAPGLASNPC